MSPAKPILYAACVSLLLTMLASPVVAQPVITITEDEGDLPDEAFFAANPTAIVNVQKGGLIAPGEDVDPFNFSGATVDINDGGSLGFQTIARSFVDNVALNVADGGVLHDWSTFVGVTGATSVDINGGEAKGRLLMQGSSVLRVNSGDVGGGQPQGQASLIAEGNADVIISDGLIGKNVTVREGATLTVVDGEIDEALTVEGSGLVSIEGGAVGRLFNIHGDDARVSISGGAIDTEFMHNGGVVDMSGGGIGTNSSVTGRAVMNMTGGALAAGFKVFNGGTLNMSGGSFGDNFRLGNFGGGPGTLNLFVDSVAIDGEPLPLAKGATLLITQRDDKFLTADLAQGGTVGLTLNDGVTTEDDFLRADSTLTITRLLGPGDYNNDGAVDEEDLDPWGDLFHVGTTSGGGFLMWQRHYDAGDAPSQIGGEGVPEPRSIMLAWGLVSAALLLAVSQKLLQLLRQSRTCAAIRRAYR